MCQGISGSELGHESDLVERCNDARAKVCNPSRSCAFGLKISGALRSEEDGFKTLGFPSHLQDCH